MTNTFFSDKSPEDNEIESLVKEKGIDCKVVYNVLSCTLYTQDKAIHGYEEVKDYLNSQNKAK